jgi:hypothetical protein
MLVAAYVLNLLAHRQILCHNFFGIRSSSFYVHWTNTENHSYQALYSTPSVPNYRKFWHFSESHVSRRILVCLFTHFNPCLVHIEISKTCYNSERRVYIWKIEEFQDSVGIDIALTKFSIINSARCFVRLRMDSHLIRRTSHKLLTWMRQSRP